MSNFVDDLTSLDFPKTSTRITAPGREGLSMRAGDWNKLCQAAYDLRSAIISLRGLTGFFSSSSPGIVPASGGGAVNFLRADGTWANINTANIANDAVTYAKLQNVSATSRFLGRITSGAGDAEELTGTQATTLLDTVTSGAKGLAPASGGGTVNFLRADGTWTAVATTPALSIAAAAQNAVTLDTEGTLDYFAATIALSTPPRAISSTSAALYAKIGRAHV